MIKRILLSMFLVLFLTTPGFAANGDRVIEGITADMISSVGLDITGVTDGNIPYMQSGAAGFSDSPLARTDATTLSVTGADPAFTLIPSTAVDTRFWFGNINDADGVDDDKFQIGKGTTPGTGPLVTVDKDGNVGIGTDSPGATLDLKKAVSTNSFTVLNIQTAWNNTLIDKGAGKLQFQARDTDVNSGENTVIGTLDALIENTWTSASNANSYLRFNTLFANTLSEKLRITSTGNVGINTTSPSEKLTVKATTNDGSTYPLGIEDSDAVEVFKVDSDGNVTTSGTISGVPVNYYGVTWNETTDSYTRTGVLSNMPTSASPGNDYLPVQRLMQRCVINDSGVVQYYLDPDDSTKKVNGSASDLTGGDGQVVVEIPLFYQRYSYSGTTHTWDISLVPLNGFFPHPAFFKDGAWVDHRYIGAYEGSMYDASDSAMATDAEAVTAMYATGDKLCSVMGQCPKTNETRAEFREMASARGAGWRQQDCYLTSAIQLLYLIEYADFDSQSMISNGRTMFSTGSWVVAGTGGYIGRTGYSNSIGNASGGLSRSSALDISAIDTSLAAYNDFMSYRGIENFFGNVWTWIDGININDNIPYVSGDEANYADDTDTNYTRLVDIGGADVTLHNANGYPATIEQTNAGFFAASVGASSATKLCDYYYQSTGWRVVRFGGNAGSALTAGAFYVYAYAASSSVSVLIGGRLTF